MGKMLSAIVLSLQPVTEARLPISHGSFAYAAALELFLRREAALARAMHEAKPHKAFTVSPLLDAEVRERNDLILSPDEVYTWRLTGLTREVSEHLLCFAPDMGGVRIGDAVFSVADVATTPEEHPDAGQDDYEALWARWKQSNPPRTVTLHFLTPTTFRIGRFEQPFPLPRWVFGSLIDLWDAFSPHPIGPLKDLMGEIVLLSNWRGETRRVEFGAHRTVGFIGKFTYRVAERLPELNRLIALLSAFAFYSGVGWQTTHGMGQVRWVVE